MSCGQINALKAYKLAAAVSMASFHPEMGFNSEVWREREKA